MMKTWMSNDEVSLRWVQGTIYSMTHLFPSDSVQLHQASFPAFLTVDFLGALLFHIQKIRFGPYVGWELFPTTGGNSAEALLFDHEDRTDSSLKRFD